jgi:C-terminal processing protease CtpA/Prc
VGEGNLNDCLNWLVLCRGLIIDIRNNTGGDLVYAERLAGRLVHEKTLVGYMQHKTGPGHQDFSDLEPRYLEPSSNLRWYKPVCVLTNRSVYSAANDFAVIMHALPNVRLVGDYTGGGSGLPMSSSLPNGWTVRYSACPMYDAQRQQTEFGIAPDVAVSLTDANAAQGVDDIIEAARKLLVQ